MTTITAAQALPLWDTDFALWEDDAVTETPAPAAAPAAPAAPAVTMSVTVINKADGSVRAHRTGCRDIKREAVRGAMPEEYFELGDFSTQADIRADYNADFDEETEGWYDIDCAPCVTLPA